MLAGALKKRIQPVPIIARAVDIFKDTSFLEDESEDKIIETATERMTELHAEVDRWTRPTFDVTALPLGYITFVKFQREKTYQNHKINLEKTYYEMSERNVR